MEVDKFSIRRAMFVSDLNILRDAYFMEMLKDVLNANSYILKPHKEHAL